MFIEPALIGDSVPSHRIIAGLNVNESFSRTVGSKGSGQSTYLNCDRLPVHAVLTGPISSSPYTLIELDSVTSTGGFGGPGGCAIVAGIATVNTAESSITVITNATYPLLSPLSLLLFPIFISFVFIFFCFHLLRCSKLCRVYK